MTLAAVEQCSEATARALTLALRQSLTVSWDLLVEAYQRRAWAALGYESWDAYTDAELGETRLRLPREQRREVVASMTEAGMSTRAIASALDVDRKTVMTDRQVVQNGPPEQEPIDAEIVPESDDLGDRIARELVASDEQYAEQAVASQPREVLGTDGKNYTVAPKPAAQRRRPLPDAARDAGWELRKAVEKVQRLLDDDRFPQNAQEVTAQLRSHLLFAAETCQGLNGRLASND